MNKKLLSIVMVLTIIMTGIMPFMAYADEEATTNTQETTTQAEEKTTAPDNETTTAPQTEEEKKKAEELLNQQKQELIKNIEESEKKLAELEKTSKLTEEYIDTLDQKIGYINEQLTLLEGENMKIQGEIDAITPGMVANEKALKKLSKEVNDTKNELKKLEDKFQSIYEAYCIRLRVMYISGEYNVLTTLLTCKDISSFLTRYEMIKSVSKSDTELLTQVNEKTKEIVTKKDGLDEKLSKYKTTKAQYDKQCAELLSKQKKIEQNSETIAKTKITLATDRAESDELLAELTAKNQQYTEFRNEDKALVEAVEKEVQDLIAGVIAPDEVTTANRQNNDKKEDSTSVTYNKSDVYNKSDAVLNMLYPIPGRYGISAGFPNYSSGKFHGGIDFPTPVGSNVVSAQSGIVLTVKRLNYSYGHYVMIYHGTDKKGRSVVTLYAHNSKVLVSAGDSVKRGQVIALSGNTGNSTGPHLHFEVRLDGKQVNPTHYLGKK